MVAVRDPVKLGAAIGDRAGEQVEASGRGFGIGSGGEAGRQRQMFDQRDDIDAAFLQHGAVAQVDLVHGEFGQPVGDRSASACEERGADPVGSWPKAQIEAGGLHLTGVDRRCRADRTGGDQGPQVLAGQDTGPDAGRDRRPGIGHGIGLAVGQVTGRDVGLVIGRDVGPITGREVGLVIGRDHSGPFLRQTFRIKSLAQASDYQPKNARKARHLRAVFMMVGPERFELSTSRPPDGRANQAALRPDDRSAS